MFCPFKFYAVVLLISGSFFGTLSGQETVRVFEIQGNGGVSPYSGKEVLTEGVVTHTLFGSGQRNGFFIQDTLGDGDDNTSDGIFVYGRQDVAPGDYVRIRAVAGEYDSRTELSGVESMEVLKRNVGLPYSYLKFPDDFDNGYENREGMAICFIQPLYLNSTYRLTSQGQIILGSKRLRAPTDYTLPGSEEYEQALQENMRDQMIVDDGSAQTNPSPVPFLDADGTCRTGGRIDTLYAILDRDGDTYFFYPMRELDFTGNPRTLRPDEDALGAYSLKVCGFNLEMFFNDSELQTARILNALDAIDADLFGLVEVGGGLQVIRALIDSLNARKGGAVYDYVAWSGHEATSTYTLNHIVYKKAKLEPYDKYFMLNSISPSNRKLLQAFTDKESGERFIFGICHFKAKSGSASGQDADQGDGQGVYNYRRVQEAYLVRSRLEELVYYYGTDRILLMGDLNALYREDPIRVFTDKSYVDQAHRFSDEDYTYTFDGKVQYLDYSLASQGMQAYVTGADVWHINADEPSYLDYQRDNTGSRGPYRCSDHDPVIVGLDFGKSSVSENLRSAGLRCYPNPASEEVFVRLPGSGKLRVYTLGGKMLSESECREGTLGLSLEGYASGVYLLEWVSENKSRTYGKFVVR